MKIDADKARSGPGVSLAVLLTTFMSVAIIRAASGNVGLSGIVLDSSRNRIAGASITLINATTGVSTRVLSDESGKYQFPDLAAGPYRPKVTYPGFASYCKDVTLDPNELRNLEMTLRLATLSETITVTSASLGAYSFEGGTQRVVDANDLARSLNAAALLADVPGASLRDNGGLASIPMLHGLDDDRIRVLTNGMTVTPSCPNHMNPPLSYIDPSAVAQVSVMAGITPASMGGDSIGGTIVVDSPAPVFAPPGQRAHTAGALRSRQSFLSPGVVED